MASERAAAPEAQQHRAQVLGHWPYAVVPQLYYLIHGSDSCSQAKYDQPPYGMLLCGAVLSIWVLDHKLTFHPRIRLARAPFIAQFIGHGRRHENTLHNATLLLLCSPPGRVQRHDAQRSNFPWQYEYPWSCRQACVEVNSTFRGMPAGRVS